MPIRCIQGQLKARLAHAVKGLGDLDGLPRADLLRGQVGRERTL